MYIHAGLHKTGTTALQDFLAAQETLLRDHGVLYPLTGRPPHSSGHHNLAWQLNRDHRYRAAYGSLRDLAEELRAHEGDAIISSEDFSTQLDDDDAWLTRLSALPGLSRYRLVPVLYLREQSAFFKSLIMQLTRNGLTEEPTRVADTICRTGSFRLREWTFHFDYLRLARRLHRATHGQTILRSYHRLSGGSTISDFAQRILPGIPLPIAASDNRANVMRDLLEALEDFYQTRLGVPLNDAQKTLLHTRAARLEGRALELSPGTARRFTATFQHANRKLCRMAGEDFAFPSPRGAATDTLEQLFSFELQCELTQL